MKTIERAIAYKAYTRTYVCMYVLNDNQLRNLSTMF